jgi:hypothetical protein
MFISNFRLQKDLTGIWHLATGNWQLASGNWQLATGIWLYVFASLTSAVARSVSLYGG